MSDTIRKLKRGLYANIHAKRERIKNGSGETMQPRRQGVLLNKDFKDSERTAKK